MDDFVERYIVRLDDGRFFMYDDEEDVEEADEVLKVKIPTAAANMFDALQSSYFIMQQYFDAQWELMERRQKPDVDEETKQMYGEFAKIVLNNELEDIWKKDEDESA